MTLVLLVKGTDDVLRGEAVTRAVGQIVGDRDRGLLVDEFSGPDYDLGSAVDAAQTPPFLTDDRVVVLRHLARFSRTEELGGLLSYLSEPLATTSLILAWERPPGSVSRLAATPPALTRAVEAAGGQVVSADAPGGKSRGAWVEQRLAAEGIEVGVGVAHHIEDHLGEDAGAMVGLVTRLVGAFGPGAPLSLADVEPFLGAAGGVAPWDLTDAIDRGDTAIALEKLQRIVEAGRHPLAVMASLQNHFVRIARLDGAGANSDKEAAALLGLKGSTFPAKKALSQGRRLGTTKLRRSVHLLAEADVDLRGAQAWPEELVVEVLVARLATLASGGRR